MPVEVDSSVSSLVMPVLIRPVLSQLEGDDVVAGQTLKAAFSRVESCRPGFSSDLLLWLVRRAGITVNLHESMLRLQGDAGDNDAEFRLSRTEEPFQELNKKSYTLKRILSRIPAEITDRRAFLETIKEIASAIKKLLDAVQAVSGYIPGSQGKQALDQKRRDFVKYSKRFSNALKEYFKEGQASVVFVSATSLIFHTNMLVVTVKNKCE